MLGLCGQAASVLMYGQLSSSLPPAISDILMHPWMRPAVQAHTARPAAKKGAKNNAMYTVDKQEGLDQGVLAALAGAGLDPLVVTESVLNGNHNHASTSYFLLKRRTDRQRAAAGAWGVGRRVRAFPGPGARSCCRGRARAHL